MTDKKPLFLLINKPATWTSFDVIAILRGGIRRITKQKNFKIGHAGTLDPFATGLLIVGVGREATRELESFNTLKKVYRATIHLGATSDTQDASGTITPFPTPVEPTLAEVAKVLETFTGEQQQIPPMFSAKKVGGKRLYKLARAGVEVKREPSTIHIYSLKLESYAWPKLAVEVTCSSGTYIRTLAFDIGNKLGTGAYCETLERTAIGDYHLYDATTAEEALTAFVDTPSLLCYSTNVKL